MCKVFIKTSLYIFIIVQFFSIKLHGENNPAKYKIGGIVKDSISGEALPFSNIQVLNSHDSSIVKGAMSNSDGVYQIEGIKKGTYIIMATFMGYTPKHKTLNVLSQKTTCNFHLIHKSISLSEVSIVAEKNLVETKIEKTTINVSQNITTKGGTAIDVMQSLPSVDIDFEGNINYRGSDKVIVLLDGEQSELTKSLDQISAEQIEKVELVNNPSAKYDAEGMSGIINIVLKKGNTNNDKIKLMVNAGYPTNLGINTGYASSSKKIKFYMNGGIKHKTKYQTKEHLRKNYQNPNSFDYYQFDRQDENQNDALIHSKFNYAINKKNKVGISLIGSKKINNADREIEYETRSKTGLKEYESLKKNDIELNNYSIDGNVNYTLKFQKNRYLHSKFHYSYLDQLREMDNTYYPTLNSENPQLQNTYTEQANKKAMFAVDYNHPFNDSILLETGYTFSDKDLTNNFESESYQSDINNWTTDTALESRFNYIQQIHAAYLNFNAKLKFIDLQAGLRCEYTKNSQNNIEKSEYLDFFPSITFSKKLNKVFTTYLSYNRRINRPTIKMLNPYSDEYADLLNMHKGNPDLNSEYVNSFELGNKFFMQRLSGLASVYYRDIDQAISRVKSASNDSALFVSFINLDEAQMLGGELSFSFKLLKWWDINMSSNIFHTELRGKYENNEVSKGKTGWNANLTNKLKLPEKIVFQASGYYRSKLPSVMGTYKERYYIDLALSKKIMKNKALLVFKVSDVFDTYKFGLDLDALDENNYRYSQKNRRKRESRYFVMSFVYNFNGKAQQNKRKESFFLDKFDK